MTTTQPAAPKFETVRPPQARPGSIRRTLNLAFRTIVCVVTFITVFSLCEGVKDLLLQ